MISIFIKAPKLRGIKLRQKPVSLINFQHGNRTRKRMGERKRETERGGVEKTHFHTHWRMGFVPRLIFNCWKMLLSMKNYLLIKPSPAIRRFLHFPPMSSYWARKWRGFCGGGGWGQVQSTVRQSRLFCPSSSVVLCRCSDDSAFGIQFIVKQHLSVSIAARREQRREGRAQGDKAKPFLKPVREGVVGRGSIIKE